MSKKKRKKLKKKAMKALRKEAIDLTTWIKKIDKKNF